MWTRKQLKDRCKLVMKRNYWNMFIVSLILTFITGGSVLFLSENNIYIEFKYYISGSFYLDRLAVFLVFYILIGAIIFDCFIISPIEFGAKRYFLLNTKENPSMKEILYFFTHDYMNIVKIGFMMKLKVVLWSFLFFIPGIVKAYEYSMIPYILSEDSSMPMHVVFARSREMMNGQKINKFILDLSFIGWKFLGSCLVIGGLFVEPYVCGTDAEFYVKMEEIKSHKYY